MLTLEKSLSAWQTDHFNGVFKDEVGALDESSLPLQEGLSRANYVDASDLSVLILNMTETDTTLQIKTGIFYQGIIAGCNCSDDPSPMASHTEYCIVAFEIDKKTAKTRVVLIEE
ncbi:MAG: hypothetical protein KAG20_02425 [Cocleimonas sp.]|nr:hypothetical protein [Cocleimonas sp.]